MPRVETLTIGLLTPCDTGNATSKSASVYGILNGIAFTAEPQATAGVAPGSRSPRAILLYGPASVFGLAVNEGRVNRVSSTPARFAIVLRPYWQDWIWNLSRTRHVALFKPVGMQSRRAMLGTWEPARSGPRVVGGETALASRCPRVAAADWSALGDARAAGGGRQRHPDRRRIARRRRAMWQPLPSRRDSTATTGRTP
jgi:hypothetical protein